MWVISKWCGGRLPKVAASQELLPDDVCNGEESHGRGREWFFQCFQRGIPHDSPFFP